MKKKTLSQAKNAMRRALNDLLDRLPSEGRQQSLRDYFDNLCAYCGSPATRPAGHIDHADPDGGNALGDLVLACPKCNGDRKREMHWEPFLDQTATMPLCSRFAVQRFARGSRGIHRRLKFCTQAFLRRAPTPRRRSLRTRMHTTSCGMPWLLAERGNSPLWIVDGLDGRQRCWVAFASARPILESCCAAL